MKFAIAICLVAVVAITAEARHGAKAKGPRGSAYAKKLSLVEKMKETLKTDERCPDGIHECDGECCPPNLHACCTDDDDPNMTFCYWSDDC